MLKQREKGGLFHLLVFFLCVSSLAAQEQSLNCKDNVQEALFYLKGSTVIAKDSLKAIEYLKPCLEAENANAQVIMGYVFLNDDSKVENKQKGFELLEKAANQNHPIALETLGLLYKYGKGCELNFNKARHYFEKASKLGNHKATYGLGYFYLKGLGNIKQNYKKAIAYFEKSEYYMAKHWLGICYLNGYGVPEDISKGNALLNTNEEAQIPIGNSAALIEPNLENIINQFEGLQGITSIDDLLEEKLYGKWKGNLVILDWSAKQIRQNIPITLVFKRDTVNNNIQYTWSVNATEKRGNTLLEDNTTYFENLLIKLPHAPYLKDEPNMLEHAFISSDLTFKKRSGNSYLRGVVESYIPAWNEPSPPIQFLLVKEDEPANKKVNLSEEDAKDLASQENNFIKLYPNPFLTDLTIAYTLKVPGHIKIKLNGLVEHLKTYTIEDGDEQQAGEYRYHFDGSKLKKGIYAVSIFVNGIKNTKWIVKK